jgi:uncharacterized protein YkwD
MSLALVAASAALLAAPAPQAALTALNDARAAHGVPALRADARLARAARRHSRDMVRRRYFDHVTPGGATLSTRVKRSGWTRGRRSWALGEDLAWGTGGLAKPEAVVAAWMDSPPHRRNVLSRRFRVVGVGIAPGTPFGATGATFTADFGS